MPFLEALEDTHDWLASLAVIGCLCMEAILGDTVFSIHFIGSVTSCVYKIFGCAPQSVYLVMQFRYPPPRSFEFTTATRPHNYLPCSCATPRCW